VGLKMVLVDIYKIPVELSLSAVVLVLSLAVMASLWRNRQLARAYER